MLVVLWTVSLAEWSACSLVLAALALAADAPPALVRGEIVEIAGTEFTLRSENDIAYRFRTDEHSYVERGEQRIRLEDLRSGDTVDVVTERTSGVRYARLVKAAPARLRAPMWKPAKIQPSIVPRGLLTFSGIVVNVSEDRMVLRLRKGEERTFRLREDTVYRADGRITERGTLQSQTRVFVRGGQGIDDKLEAYEVVWGEILRPHGVR